MKVKEIIQLTEAILVYGENRLDDEVEKAFSSDLMSDVLTIDSEDILLITGLANTQAIRTAEMADIHYILLVRNKKATPEMIELARENAIVLMETPYSLFKTSGILYESGLKPVY
jgi:meiotically up-regulated gene 157 (Mug157) protein